MKPNAPQWLVTGTATIAIALATSSAHAVPSYARQTGAECAACHVGAFGPQLTPYGVRFKIGGYTETDGRPGKVPLSGMLVGTYTRTARDVAAADKVEGGKRNDNYSLQEASLFLAGRISEHVGSFIQATWSGVDHKSALDQVDVRYARATTLLGRDATFGVSLNSNPTLTDPLNTLGQWRFPFVSSEYNAGLGPTPLVESLAGTVIGANAYALVGPNLYAEFGLYNAMPRNGLAWFNTGDAGKLKGTARYARLAYLVDRKRDNFSVGAFAFDAALQPDRTDLGTADRYRDVGLDASYQFLGNRRDIFTVNGSWVSERQTLDYTQGKLGEADNANDTLQQFRLAGSYHYDQTWGTTLGMFNTHGSVDATRYASSRNASPNTSGWLLQADWTPFGKERSWGAPWANLRLGAQYTKYNRFMGGSSYLDGDGAVRRARDNDTLMLFVWTSI